MAITQVGVSTFGSRPASGTFNVAKPTGVAEGDVLIVIGCSNKNSWTTLPSGFQQFAVTSDAGISASFRVYGWYKVCGPSEPTNYTFGSAGADTDGAPMVATITAYRGVDNTNPVMHTAVDQGNTSTGGEPANPTGTAFVQSDLGLLFYARAVRRGGTGGTARIPSFTNSSGSWSEAADHGSTSGTSSTNYGIGYFHHNTETGSGNRSEPAVSVTFNDGGDEDSNGYILGCLKTAPAGDIAASTPSVTAAFDGYHRIDATLAASTPKVTAAFQALGAPPEGSLAASAPKVTAAFQATSLGGHFAGTLPSIQADVEGAVNPIGHFEGQLPSIVASFVTETTPFGEHVIRVEREDRAFRVVDDGITSTGLKPIKRSRVTDA